MKVYNRRSTPEFLSVAACLRAAAGNVHVQFDVGGAATYLRLSAYNEIRLLERCGSVSWRGAVVYIITRPVLVDCVSGDALLRRGAA